MSTPRFAALGWELSHPQILAADPRSAESWNQAAAVFISTSAIEQLWAGAAVERGGKRAFESAADEAQAWERVESLTRNLRRVLRRGGAVICRLDPPEQGREYERVGIERPTEQLVEVEIPRVTLPARPGSNIATVVEAAARDEQLRRSGVNGAARLDQQLRREMGEPG